MTRGSAGGVGTLWAVAESLRISLQARWLTLFALSDRRLIPLVAVAADADVRLWHKFLSLPPAKVIPGQQSVLSGTSPVVLIRDARATGLIPQEWAHRFDLGRIAVASLMDRDGIWGVVVADEPAAPGYSDDLLAITSSIQWILNRSSCQGLVSERQQRARTDIPTVRQLEALWLMAQQLTTREIARAMGVSESTANTHVDAVFARFRVANRLAAVREGWRRGLIPPRLR